MDLELKAKWIEALRSGNYKQGQKSLRPSDDHYCCLGVLCEVADIPANCKEGVWTYKGHMQYAPKSLLPGEVQQQLAEMNDHGDDFDVIASWIEHNV